MSAVRSTMRRRATLETCLTIFFLCDRPDKSG